MGTETAAKPAADGTATVYKTTEHRYQVDRDLNRKAREQLEREELGLGMQGELKVRMRGLLPSDFHFILNAWMQSYRVQMRGVNNEDYYTGQQNLIAEIAKRRQCIVACDSDNQDYIYGFIVGQMFESGVTLIDYIYVKKFYRERGIARALLSALGVNVPKGVIVTHLTPAIIEVVQQHRLTYNPYYNTLGCGDV